MPCKVTIRKRENKEQNYKNTYRDVYSIFIFVITKTLKQPSCPSVAEWINKLWYIQTVEYYSALKTNALSSHEKTWRNPKYFD